MLEPGDALPDVTLTAANGEQMALRDFIGRPLIVYFYPKADTPGCTNEAKDFTDLAEQFGALAIPVLGISKDKPAKLAKFAQKYGLSVQLLSDEDGAACEAFGTWVEKKLYGRDYMGIARATFLFGVDGKATRVWPAVKVKGHAAEVLEVARALG